MTLTDRQIASLAHDDTRSYPVIEETDGALVFQVAAIGRQLRFRFSARRASWARADQAPVAALHARLSRSYAPEGGLYVQVQWVVYADGTRSEYIGIVLQAEDQP